MGKGRILSLETMGLVDGPGIRTVVFFQGCALRCQFCHNPDSWSREGGETVTSEDLFRKILRFRPYFERSGGGVTFSGGEPLLQPEFLTELLRLCRGEGIHTCLDTAGVGLGTCDYGEILSLTDLVLYDVKATDAEAYREMCGADLFAAKRFEAALRKHGTETIVRRVLLPGINDSDREMQNLQLYLKENLPMVRKVELLPYHRMGAYKYQQLGIREPLQNLPEMDRDTADKLWKTYFENWERNV